MYRAKQRVIQGTLILSLSLGFAHAQSKFLVRSSLLGGQTQVLIPSNSISHIETRGTLLWAGTGKGLASTLTGGRSWQSYRSLPQFANTGIFALTIKGDTVWASTGFSKDVENVGSVQTGSGYTYSLDNGTTWNSLPQTLDAQSDSLVTYGRNIVNFLPVTVPEQNVTFDISLTDSIVWIASWSSGLRKSNNLGRTWQRTVLPDDDMTSISPDDSLGNYEINPVPVNNFKVFSVFAENPSVIWAGSAGGINKSTDGGISWQHFRTNNQVAHILSNWVIAIRGQQLGSTTRIWATNWPAEGAGERFGVSYTDDGGRIWTNTLFDIKAYDFAFRDSIVYVSTEEGLYRSADGGRSWNRSGPIIDSRNGARITSPVVYAAGIIGDTVYAGTSDGLATTIDDGNSAFGQVWSVFRAYQPVGTGSATYAYPNPFSPRFEATRIHYSTGLTPANVNVELFDFGMNRVRTIVMNAPRTADEHDEIWDGRNDAGAIVPNGVYFYRVNVGGNDPAWGKIMVIQ